MTKVEPLARAHAPTLYLAGHRAAPTPAATDTTTPPLRTQAENALTAALELLRSAEVTAADLQRATGRVIRAATAMKRLSAAQVERGAA